MKCQRNRRLTAAACLKNSSGQDHALTCTSQIPIIGEEETKKNTPNTVINLLAPASHKLNVNNIESFKENNILETETCTCSEQDELDNGIGVTSNSNRVKRSKRHIAGYRCWLPKWYNLLNCVPWTATILCK